ncbi:MAG: hypothetical protein AB3N14_07265 [Flavobacteriaceae bacterium]
MKTKTLLILFAFVLTSSCIKDYIGKKNKIEITENNYVYEGEIYSLYLTLALEEVEEEIQTLQDIIDNNQGDTQTEEDLAAAQEQQAYLNNELVNVIDLVSRGIVPPRPPCPDRLCLPAELQYIITDRALGDFFFEVFDANGGSLYSADASEARRLRGSGRLANFNEIEPVNYVGEITINVIRNDSQGNEVQYEVAARQE